MRKLAKNEINLFEVYLFIFLNKYKILFITIITIIIAFSFGLIKLQPVSKTFLIKAQIHPISVFEASKYQEYNSYVSNMIEKRSESNYILNNSENSLVHLESNYFEKIFHQNIRKNNLEEINSMYLYNLLISIFSEDEKLIKFIKKNNIIKKEKFQDNKLYENEVKELVSSISVTDFDFLKDEDMLDKPSLYFSNIQLEVKKLEVGMKFFDLISFYINQEIKNHITKEFDNYVIISKQKRRYRIEDIEFEIENNLEDENITKKLKKLKKRLMRLQDLERLKNIFNKTPVFSNEFIAGKFKAFSYEEVLHEKNNYKLNVFKFILLGLLLSLIYIMLENIFKKSKKLKSH